MTDLLMKYQPDTIKEFIGNRVLIRGFLDSLSKSPCEVLIIGPSGGGKTLLCNLTLKEFEHKYDVLRINGDETEDVKSLKRLIDNFVNNRTIESFFSSKQKLVLFDNVDILLTSDRNTASFLLNFVENAQKQKHVSYIMTCSTSEEKRLTELKKKVQCIRLSNPSRQDTFVYVSAILDTEDIHHDSNKLLRLIDTHNNNIRNIVLNLHQMSMSDKDLTAEKKTKLMFDSNVFDIMKKVYAHPLEINDIRCLSDNGLVPLLMHENMLNELQKNRVKQSNDVYYKLIDKTNDFLIDAEFLEHYMYHHTEWSLYDTVSILKCGSINQLLSSVEKKKSSSFDGYVFTQLLTKSALRCHYNKRLNGLKSSMEICEVDTLFYFLDCLANEMTSDASKIKKIKKYLSDGPYHLTKDDFSTLQQYFSLFVEMDKSVLNKFKKSL